MIPTQDPHVFIEEHDPTWGYVRYQQLDEQGNIARRWEVFGHCVGLAHCIVGSVIDGEEITTLERAKEIWYGHEFILDCPITPEFEGCCPFTYNELDV